MTLKDDPYITKSVDGEKRKVKFMLLEFLKYAYFNITESDSKDDILSKCANKAYMDLCRTIKFKKSDDSDRAKCRTEICNMLVKEYYALKNAVESADDKQTVFDNEHERICDKIRNTYKISKLTYGQAQKWLNMMLKYIFLIEGDSILKSYLHIPVDRYIMQAVGSDNPELKCCLKLKCIPKDNGTLGKYTESTSKVWSKWDDYKEYYDFQKAVRAAISEIGFNSPIEWENAAWIEVAEYRNK